MGKERKEFVDKRMWSKGGWKAAVEVLEEPWKEIQEESFVLEEDKIKEKINGSKYIKEQKELIYSEERASYLDESKKIPVKTVARFRLGSENLSSRFWNQESKRKCRLYKEEEETLEHIFQRCKWTRGEKKVREILNKEEPDIEYMNGVYRIRNERENQER